jgi:hypothetical protein
VSLENSKKLNSLPDSYKKLFRIIERPELDAIGADPNAILALARYPVYLCQLRLMVKLSPAVRTVTFLILSK